MNEKTAEAFEAIRMVKPCSVTITRDKSGIIQLMTSGFNCNEEIHALVGDALPILQEKYPTEEFGSGCESWS